MKFTLRISTVICCLLAGLVALGPIYWAVVTSFKSSSHIFAVPPEIIPLSPTVQHYVKLVAEGVQWAFLNSAGYAIVAVLIALILGSIAGYALTRFPVAGKPAVLLIFVGAMAVPAFAVLLPTQMLATALGLQNTWSILPILYAGHILPFAVWVTRSHFASIPRELEQAAELDGYSRAEAVWKIVLPGAKPALLAAATFGFLHCWNDYVTGSTMVDSPDLRTLQVALIFFQGFHGRDWGALMAGVVIATIPPVVVFLLFRKFLIGGFADGSVKG
ncbi:carbohydrate ABC transporter permease [Advenella mimigardefordensis]|uniref:Putative ABC transporter permease protein n=1 Tax=Advenella mimigardefordensis (strain DSM 17166 / LMG 22922 / DPN7) TaxID=1247726 RepID=W0P5X8_ADVMD|nr:carbohydrate ABC transporter permease [Advenella mimigardefordensis]AHG62161.1 putative ABC transporter permease protein [Advenella mimigardefordensis DPN7]